jgi:hypothetical protein
LVGIQALAGAFVEAIWKGMQTPSSFVLSDRPEKTVAHFLLIPNPAWKRNTLFNGDFMAQPEFLTIDNKRYAIENLDDNARAQIVNLQVVDNEIAHAQQQLAILGTARAAYLSVLRQALAQVTPESEVAPQPTH